MFPRAFVIVALLSGCATADRENGQQVSLVDAANNNNNPPPIDARNVTPPVDGHVNPPGVDAPSGGCTPMMDDLLANGNMDGSPAGTGWTATPADPMYPVIGSSMPASYSPDTAPNVAWMGGVPGNSATDSMYQDFTVPASTTSLVLTGSYMVLTSETGTTAKDKATVELRTTSGTKIESVTSLSNTSATTGWTPLNHTFTSLSAGQTVRLYFTSTATSSTTTMNVTDFFFDSLQLVATHCD